MGGDWKQLCPVIPRGTHLEQLNASVKMSELFKYFETYRLVTNHRLEAGQEHYRNFLRRVGVGSINDEQYRVELPQEMVTSERVNMLNFVFPPNLLRNPLANWKELAGRAILTPLNKETFELNTIIMVI